MTGYVQVLQATAAIALTLTLLPAAVPAYAATDTCAKVSILTFRGSGEHQVESSPTAIAARARKGMLSLDGWEGETIRRALRAYEDAAGAPALAADKVEVLGVGWDAKTQSGYHAIAVQKDANNPGPDNAMDLGMESASEWALDNSGGIPGVSIGLLGHAAYSHVLAEIYRSSLTGAKHAAEVVSRNNKAKKLAGCSRPMYMSAGYSQGEMAARVLYSSNGENGTLKAVFALGDPYQTGQKTQVLQQPRGLNGEGADGMGIFVNQKLVTGALHKNEKPVPLAQLVSIYETKTPKFLRCHNTDPMCDNSNAFSLIAPDTHTNYLKARKFDTTPQGTDPGRAHDQAKAAQKKSSADAEKEKALVAEWFTGTVKHLASEPAPAKATMANWNVEGEPGPWFAGRNARIDVSGAKRAASSTLTVDLIPDTGDETGLTTKAYPRTPNTVDSFDIPAFYPRGSHVLDIPADVPTGSYLIRVRTTAGTVLSTKHVYILAFDVIADWAFASEDEYQRTGVWQCSTECADGMPPL